MRFKARLKSKSGEHGLDLDLSSVTMTQEQQIIAGKLFQSIQDEVIDIEAKDSCEQGKCVASKHLTPDEFSKIRGLKAELTTLPNPGGIIADFCIHVVRVPH